MTENDLLIVSKEEAGLRLDSFLASRFSDYSRAYFQHLVESKLVLVNGELVKKAAKVAAGDEIEVEFAITADITLEAEDIALDILYEDSYLLAVNKPAGMVVHPAIGNWKGTFVNALLFYMKHLPSADTLRPGIVHRLDKDTSGVLLAAKDELTQRRLVELFSARKVYKEYLAICIGNPGKREIIAPIGRHPIRRKQMAVLLESGKPAQTLCETLSFNQSLSLVKLHPFTGRTHQLRVHMQFTGFPILGDAVYGSLSCNKKFGAKRQLLHAYALRFLHPITQEEIVLQAPIPEDLHQFIQMIQS